jgi:hypothetical protein
MNYKLIYLFGAVSFLVLRKERFDPKSLSGSAVFRSEHRLKIWANKFIGLWLVRLEILGGLLF